ncbi:hypothetical protein [Clostridium sp. B9]|uniref:hypothetical protein n=1 Tax=Clostridium sp. B9 TaxID=3423224 RepID=UPI003D2EDED2
MKKNIRNKMSVGQFIKSTFNIIKSNLLDIVFISVLFAIPAILIGRIGILSFLSIFCSGFSAIAIIKLVNSFARGTKLTWVETIKESFKNPIFPLGVFIIQTFVVSFGSGIFAPLGIVLQVFFILAMQIAVVEDSTVVNSIKRSFDLIKNNFLDVLLKQFVLVMILNLITMALAMFLNQSIPAIIIFTLILNIALSFNLVAGNVIYRDLSTN